MALSISTSTLTVGADFDMPYSFMIGELFKMREGEISQIEAVLNTVSRQARRSAHRGCGPHTRYTFSMSYFREGLYDPTFGQTKLARGATHAKAGR